MKPKSFFILNLLQDFINLRPLIYLVRDDLNIGCYLLVTNSFIKRDKDKTYINELKELALDTSCSILYLNSESSYESIFSNCSKGFLVSASESTLYAHYESSDIMTYSPPHIVNITIQHGFECVGFLHNYNHSSTHGNLIGFTSDIICGWIDKSYQRNLLPSSHSKYIATGPSTAITSTSKRSILPKFNSINIKHKIGLFCENIHSARFSSDNSISSDFYNTFYKLSLLLKGLNQKLALRPHPAGKFKKSIQSIHDLPDNIIIESKPTHLINWNRYSYGVSAPSSVLFDMYFNNIPICIWRDKFDFVDSSLLSCFPSSSIAEEIFSFSQSNYLTPFNNLSPPLQSLYTYRKYTAHNFLQLFKSIIYS